MIDTYKNLEIALYITSYIRNWYCDDYNNYNKLHGTYGKLTISHSENQTKRGIVLLVYKSGLRPIKLCTECGVISVIDSTVTYTINNNICNYLKYSKEILFSKAKDVHCNGNYVSIYTIDKFYSTQLVEYELKIKNQYLTYEKVKSIWNEVTAKVFKELRELH